MSASRLFILPLMLDLKTGIRAAILDALKKHNAPATFFLVGNYLETAPDLVRRMVAEGHTVGNHTLSIQICLKSQIRLPFRKSWKV